MENWTVIARDYKPVQIVFRNNTTLTAMKLITLNLRTAELCVESKM
jgi:hypothetical protein